jgi:hypothetical protein
MKRTVLIIMSSFMAFYAFATQETTCETAWPGLVAHYFTDPVNWDGNWPEGTSVPKGNPADWTFTEYKYSRVEPLVNHLFIRKGWFSIRWTGYLDPRVSVESAPSSVRGKININPNNTDLNEFTLVLDKGDILTQRDLSDDYAGYAEPARSVRVKPKGNADQNGLTVNGSPYPLSNGRIYDITSSRMMVRLYNDHGDKDGKAKGQWWIEITADDATISCLAESPAATSRKEGNEEYFFEILADDGCRLLLDGNAIINDWNACSEKSPKALRKARPVKLTDGRHRITIEYFQGQSLRDNDQDPIVLYWSCPSRNIQRQVVPASVFSHDDRQTTSSSR